jgi:5'-nucleotidase
MTVKPERRRRLSRLTACAAALAAAVGVLSAALPAGAESSDHAQGRTVDV